MSLDPDQDGKPHPEKITFVSQGISLPALLFARDRSVARPGVVVLPGRVGAIEDLAWLCQPLAEAGFVTLAIQYRPIQTQYYFTDVEDVLSALEFLRALNFVAPFQLGVVGHSRGGIAALNAARKADSVKAIVALSPVTDHLHLVKGLREFAPSRYELMVAARGGTPEEIPDYYLKISPRYHADQIRIPVLLIHGTSDLITPHEHSVWMLEALKKAGNERTSLELIQGAGHFFEQTYHGYAFEKVAGLAVTWMQEHLK